MKDLEILIIVKFLFLNSISIKTKADAMKYKTFAIALHCMIPSPTSVFSGIQVDGVYKSN